MFSKETYIQRRSRLRKELGSGIILLLGSDESPMNYADNTYHFRQDSNVLYFSGISHPEIALVLDVDQEKDILFGDDYTIDHIVWMGQQPKMSERAARSGMHETNPISKLKSYLEEAKQKGRKIHFTPPYRPENKIKLFHLLGILPDESKKASSLDLVKAIVAQRNYKSKEELDQIEMAVNITVDMHLAAMRMARPGMKESVIAAEMERIALAAGGKISFPVIATINGQTLHNHYHGNTLVEERMFLLDCGAETPMGYAGDMSSTFPVGKRFTEKQKEIYQVALDSHEKAISLLKPGIAFKEVYLESAKTIMQGMKNLGFVKGNIEDAVAQGAHAMFFPCGLGHMMGLDVHDMEDLGEEYVGYDNELKSTQFGMKSLRLGRKLEPGFVLTIEPGIYFIPDLIDLWKSENRFSDYLNYEKINAYRDFGGCRNEEDFVITENGYRLLGKELPKTIIDVEKEREKAF